MSSWYQEEEAVGYTEKELASAAAKLEQDQADKAAALNHLKQSLAQKTQQNLAAESIQEEAKKAPTTFTDFSVRDIVSGMGLASPASAVEQMAPVEKTTEAPQQTTEKSGSFVPGGVATGTPDTPPMMPPTPQTGGIDYQIGAIRRQQTALGDIAKTEAQIALGEGFYGLTDAEGNPVQESIATARLRKEMDHRDKVATWEGEFKGEMDDFRLEAKYSGAPLASVKSWQAVLDEDVRDTSRWNRASLDEKLEIEKQDRIKKARAQSRLDTASRIDPSGPFRGIMSKMIATFGIALGAKASSLSGGPNQALQMYQLLVSNDVNAQKTNWQKRRSEYADKKSEYGEMMARFGSEHAADLGLAVLQYNKGIELLKGQVLTQKNNFTKAQMDVTIGGLIAQRDQMQNALKKEFFLMKQREDSGLADLEGNLIRFIGARKGFKQDPQDKKAIREELDAATDMKQALENYVEASKDPDAWKWFGTAQKKAETMKETLIQMSSGFFGMGVLQEFEREVLAAVVPGGGTAKEKFITLITGADQSRLEAYYDAMNKFINDKLHSKIARFTHYETTGRKRNRYARTGEKPESEKAQKLYKERTK
tara:strand:+ start:657 stop:2438 length:1782 start_codon:yes stop_codon:yes gene_type:complete